MTSQISSQTTLILGQQMFWLCKIEMIERYSMKDIFLFYLGVLTSKAFQEKILRPTYVAG